MTFFAIFMEVAIFFVFIGIGIYVWNLLSSQKRDSEFDRKQGLFEWHYEKLLLSYKTKVLKDEIKKRNVSMEDLNNIMNEALGIKTTTKHVLDEIEEEVKGEVKKASSK